MVKQLVKKKIEYLLSLPHLDKEAKAKLDELYWIYSLLLKENKKIVEMGLVEEEPRNIEVCGSWFTKSEYDKLAQSEEEKKIPEKIKTLKHSCNFDRHEEILYENQVDLANKITEILDYLKSKGE